MAIYVACDVGQLHTHSILLIEKDPKAALAHPSQIRGNASVIHCSVKEVIKLFSWGQRVQICAFQAGICGVGRQLIPADLVHLAVEIR
jgi:hypothetical protein